VAAASEMRTSPRRKVSAPAVSRRHRTPLSATTRQIKVNALLPSSDYLVVLGVSLPFMFGVVRAFALLELSTTTRCLVGVAMLAVGLFLAYRLMASGVFPSSSLWSGVALGLIGIGINQAALPWRIRRGMRA